MTETTSILPFRQGAVRGIDDPLTALAEGQDARSLGHGVSLHSGGPGKLDTRLDTPPSSDRRHLGSAMAPFTDSQNVAQFSMTSSAAWIKGTDFFSFTRRNL